MSQENSKESLSDASNNSFVILGSGSFISVPNDDPVPKSDNTGKIAINSESMNGFSHLPEATINGSNFPPNDHSPNTITLDVNPQDKLNQLLRENYQLKETLNQNNLAIRTQLNTFFMWQQEVLKTHESHRQKFLETKNLILSLRAENVELKKQLETNSARTSLVDFELETSVNKSVLCSECMERKQECASLQDMYIKEVRKNESLVAEKNQTEEKMEGIKQEITKLSRELGEVKRENENLKQRSLPSEESKNLRENFTSSLLPNCEARMQIRNLFKQLEEERAKVANLKEKLKSLQRDSENQLENAATTDQELTKYLNELSEMDESFQRQTQRINGLSSWIYLTEENLRKSANLVREDDGKIMSELAQLKSHINREENVYKQREENLQGMQEQFNKLLKDYKDLQQELSSMKANEKSCEKYKRDIMALSEDAKAKDDALKAKDEELNALKEAVKKLSLECEEVAILKVQMELYKSDFHEERAAREKLVGEKEEMAEQMRLMQNLIKDLEREKENNSSSSESPNASLESSQEGLKSELPPENKRSHYVCPKCMFSFSDLRRCQEHIEDCVNIHFYP